MGAFRVVQLQRPGDGVQDRGADAGQDPALEFGVVLDAHPGQRRDLATPQARDAPLPDVGQADVAGGHLRPPGGEELADLGSVVHVDHGRAEAGRRRMPCRYTSRQGLLQKRVGRGEVEAPHHIRPELTDDWTAARERSPRRRCS